MSRWEVVEDLGNDVAGDLEAGGNADEGGVTGSGVFEELLCLCTTGWHLRLHTLGCTVGRTVWCLISADAESHPMHSGS